MGDPIREEVRHATPETPHAGIQAGGGPAPGANLQGNSTPTPISISSNESELEHNGPIHPHQRLAARHDAPLPE